MVQYEAPLQYFDRDINALVLFLQMLKRFLFLGMAGAVMLMVIRPPLPIRGGAKCPRLPFHLCPRLWDETHVPMHETDDINIYGGGLAWREHWALWLLVLAIVLAGFAASLTSRAFYFSVAAGEACVACHSGRQGVCNVRRNITSKARALCAFKTFDKKYEF
jgi:hypothetical protein